MDRKTATEAQNTSTTDNKPVENVKLAGTVTEGNTDRMGNEKLHDSVGKMFYWVKGYKDGKVVYENMAHSE